MRRPSEFANFPPELETLAAFGPYRAVIKHIVDGDTYDVLCDAGLNRYPYITIRLLGVDTPETNRAASREAGLAAKAFVEALAPVGTACVITTEPDAMTFGRYVASVELADGTNLAQALLDSGHAAPMRAV